jgi:CTP-dependent riboflavin kinase
VAAIIWAGVVCDGLGHCSTQELPDEYVPGSLNLKPAPGHKKLLDYGISGVVLPKNPWHMPVKRFGSVFIADKEIPCLVGLGNNDLTEIRAQKHLRTEFGLVNGDVVVVKVL